MKERLTKQGVRDLGGNSRANRQCPPSSTGQHVASRQMTVVGKTLSWSSRVGYYNTDVHGYRCVWCGTVLERQS